MPFRRSASSTQTRPSNAPLEADAWGRVGQGWRPLFGRFRDVGVSFEWHDFELDTTLDWARSFHPGSVELCLNLAGSARVASETQSAVFQPLSAGFYVPGTRKELQASRHPGQSHRFLTVEFSARYLAAHLEGCLSGLHPTVRSALTLGPDTVGVGPVEPMTPGHVELVKSLRRPPVAAQAQQLWFEAKAAEVMAQFLFRPETEEFFCTRQHRLARDRSERVKEILGRDLAAPPTLESIGKEVGCSPYHLSRTFSAETGFTIPQYLRTLRMERAAELLRSGKCNVTEAAFEVGYSSLSHFSSAFQETFGCCPGLYPVKGYAPNRTRP